MAFKYEKVTMDVIRQKIEARLQTLEDRRADAELDELSPSTSPANYGGIAPVRGVFDPATGASVSAADADQKTVIEQIDAEITALREKRDALPKAPTASATAAK